MNTDDSNLFSVEESERTFSQFDEEPVELEPNRQTDSSTPVVPVLDNDSVTSPAPEGWPRPVATIQLLLYMIWLGPSFAVSNGSHAVWIDDCVKSHAYCGYELVALGWLWDTTKALGYDKDALYQCLGGTNVSLVKICEKGCVKTTKSSYCAEDGTCEANRTYCGHRLPAMGLVGYDNNSLYICDSRGQVNHLQSCSQGCGYSSCHCVPGQTYCGSELVGWTKYKDLSTHQVLYRCTNRTRAEHSVVCLTGCISHDSGSYCECETNATYCGRKLHNMGWRGYDNSTLYRCDGGTNNLTSIGKSQLCEPCIIGQSYCGHDLQHIQHVAERDLQVRYVCNHNGSHNIEWMSYCWAGCITNENGSYCACEVNKTYCGDRLHAMGLVGYDNTLYICESTGQVRHLQSCPRGCAYDRCRCASGQTYCGSELVGWTIYEDVSTHQVLYRCTEWETKHIMLCLTGCISHDNGSYCACETSATYCGWKLQNMGWRGYDISTLYRCHGGSNNLTSLGKSHLCEPCIIGRSYCGHELQHIQHVAERDLRMRYVCNHNGSHNIELISYCWNGCNTNENGSYCACEVNQVYCGHRLPAMGLVGYDNNSLYICDWRGAVSHLQFCSQGCRYDRCDCAPGQTYCGSELVGWTIYEDVSTHQVLYLCTNRTSAKRSMVCHTGCISHDSGSYCACETSATYCGWNLHNMGWRGYDNSTLYRCDGGSINLTSLGKSQLCEPCIKGESYCGHDLQHIQHAAEHYLQMRYVCNQDGSHNIEWISYCRAGCITNENGSYCACEVNQVYCGHRLPAMGLVGYDNNSLFICDNRGQLSQLQSCPHGCEFDDCLCAPGKTYCGSELISWTNYEDLSTHQVLYQCTNRTQAEHIAVCLTGCIAHDSGSYCACEINATYCGYELAALGWLWDTTKALGYDKDALYQCLGGRNVSLVKICEKGCVKTTKISYCAEDGKCEANRTYCGRTLMELGQNESDSDTIYLCDSDGKNTTTLVRCSDTCVQGHHAICPCHPGRSYCGHDLYEKSNWWRAYSDNERSRWLQLLGHCTNGSHIEQISYCTDGCITQENGSYCACKVNKTYCGHRLPAMGLVGYDNNSMYICDSGGQVSHLQSCPHGCRYSGCDCAPGRTYCGSELVGWTIYEDVSTHQVLYWCMDRTRVKRSVYCLTGCISHDNGSYCACETNATYCGQKLHNMGWRDYDNSTLYRCHGGRNNLTSLGKSRLCEPCIIGRSYCGHELQHSHYVAEGDLHVRYEFSNDTLFRCKDEETIEPVEHCAKGDCQSRPLTGGSHCLCTPGQTYCGHELYSRYNSEDTYLYLHNIYQCSASKLLVNVVESCHTCVSISGTPRCHAKCLVNRYYCGNELLSLEGWKDTGLEPNGLYKCANETTALLVQNCTAECQLSPQGDAGCLCTPGQTYCGHQLYSVYYFDLYWHNIYECSSSKGEFNVVVWCGTCVSIGGKPQCQAKCHVNRYYCGNKLLSLEGWKDTGLEPNSLYTCANETTALLVQNCTAGCQLSPLGDDYCLCTPGQTYCGHELYRRYNSEDRFLHSHNIYQCSASQLLVKVVDWCGRCVSIGGTPRCQAECLVNRYYCGNKLLSLEGWKDTSLQPNGLYHCANGTTALLAQNCAAGCQLDDEHSDAYCSAVLSLIWRTVVENWYWIFLGTVLPIIFVILLLLLIRAFIKHRSLKRIIQRHRIDSSQLMKVEKIGAGEFGEVWKGKYSWGRHSVIDVALKVSKHQLGTKGVQEEALASAKRLEKALASANCLFREVVALILNLEHKNIIKMYGVCSNLEGGTESALVLEYLNGGSSIDYVRSERKRLMSGDLSRIFVDICQACRYLGEKGVVHRDIRACNVLVQKDLQTGQPLVAKLADFGLAKYIGKAGIYKLTGQTAVPACYTAPEGLRFDGSITVQADVWSFGVFMWELYMLMSEELAADAGDPGPLPFWQEVENGRRLESPSTAPSEAYSIMNRCWLYKPEARPTFEQLIGELKILWDLKPPARLEAQIPHKVEPSHPNPLSASYAKPATLVLNSNDRCCYERWVPS